MATRMRVLNVSRSTELADHAMLADGFVSRLRGLLGRDGLEPGDGLVIEPCTSVHMWGMRFALDIVHLDKKGKVLKVLPNLKPGALGPYLWRSHTAVELPAGTIAASGTEAGDMLRFERVEA
jgi:uncharacterized membrane protein (UPF0127 family)